jgi:soluble cytochrome b562
MPSNFRQNIKQKLSSVQIEIQKAMDKTTEVGILFEKDHPDYYEGFCQIVAGLDQLRDAVSKMSDAI